ncbi:hypothetical protein AGLY_005640 [Aphis glycines]|uniref:Uncharacterized protein n=1 Tax=Aphis glycines TaxID=307491 RepID=A0A6G0TUA3_APHGL|nr:hypothetical protein AGLY_005640 [Aphis glycines]
MLNKNIKFHYFVMNNRCKKTIRLIVIKITLFNSYLLQGIDFVDLYTLKNKKDKSSKVTHYNSLKFDSQYHYHIRSYTFLSIDFFQVVLGSGYCMLPFENQKLLVVCLINIRYVENRPIARPNFQGGNAPSRLLVASGLVENRQTLNMLNVNIAVDQKILDSEWSDECIDFTMFWFLVENWTLFNWYFKVSKRYSKSQKIHRYLYMHADYFIAALPNNQIKIINVRKWFGTLVTIVITFITIVYPSDEGLRHDIYYLDYSILV